MPRIARGCAHYTPGAPGPGIATILSIMTLSAPYARLLAVAGLIALIAASRLLPHPPNFTPVLAAALFCGGLLPLRRALLVPLGAMFASDLILGLHAGMASVYLAMALCVLLGRLLPPQKGLSPALGGALAASVLFFVVTNFAVWLSGSLYPPTAAGLLACYVAALPFFHHTLLSTLLCAAVFFGISRAWPAAAPVRP